MSMDEVLDILGAKSLFGSQSLFDKSEPKKEKVEKESEPEGDGGLF